MSNPITRKGWMVLLCTILLNACSKPDQQADSQPPDKSMETDLVTISLQGRVTDQQAAPVAGAVVRSGNHVTSTDINGNYRFSSIRVKPNSGMVEVLVNGYFREYKGFEVMPETEHYVRMQLEPLKTGLRFSASSGGTYNLPSGSSIDIAADAISESANGQQYTGTVLANAFSKDADDPFFYGVIPGSKGRDLQNKAVSIQFISAVVTELTGEAGQQLQLKTGKSALVKFPVPSSMAMNAPGAVSLWYYDPLSSEWKEEGKAHREGNFYIANLPHFSTWAVGSSQPSSPIKATITDVSGEVFSFARIQLYSADGKKLLGSPAHTNNKGDLIMNAPSNQAMEIRIINSCDEVLASQKINTGSSNNWLGTIRAGMPGTNALLLSGKVQNCKSATVYKGWVTIVLDGQQYKAAINNGTFQLNLNRCYNTNTYAKITAVDEESNQESNTILMEVSTGKVDLGLLSTCNKRNMQFISYTLNGTNYLLQAPADSLVQAKGIGDKSYVINCYKATDPTAVAFSLSFSGNETPGEYPVTALKFSQNKSQLTSAGTWLVKITEFGKVGDYIEGTANGNMRDLSSNRTLPFNFRFKVIRNK